MIILPQVTSAQAPLSLISSEPLQITLSSSKPLPKGGSFFLFVVGVQFQLFLFFSLDQVADLTACCDLYLQTQALSATLPRFQCSFDWHGTLKQGKHPL